MSNFIFATNKLWHLKQFSMNRSNLLGHWFLVTEPEDLLKLVENINPKYIFFPHWSYIVPDDLVENFDCVCFHPSDLPQGRGGSPIQNQILNGIKETKLTAFKMNTTLDTGPIYAKRPLSLLGSADKIFEEISEKTIELIDCIIKNDPKPVEQNGTVSSFKRRLPKQSEIDPNCTIENFYDHVRMLDVDGYPRAFLQYGRFRLELSAANFSLDRSLSANIRVRNIDDEN